MPARGGGNRRTPWRCRAVVSLGILLLALAGRELFGAPPAAGSEAADGGELSADLSVAEFVRLGRRERLEYLRRAVLALKKKTSNISYTVTKFAKNVEFDHAANPINIEFDSAAVGIGTKIYKLNGVPQTCDRVTNHVWRSGASYRVLQTKEPTMPKPFTEAIPIIVWGFDAQAGEHRCWRERGKNDAVGRNNASIQSREQLQPGSEPQDFFSQHLTGGNILCPLTDMHGWFLKAVVSHLDLETGKVEVTFPYPEDGTQQEGTIRETFDLAKQALLVGIKIDTTSGKPRKSGRWEEELRTPIEVDGVWIPTQMWAMAADSEYPDHVTIYDGAVTYIELGKVTQADLKIEFPVGTDVHDFITGKKFKVGGDAAADSK